MISSVVRLQAPFERLKLYTNNPEVALRKAIILQAIIDASNSSLNTNKITKEAREWLFGGSSYFYKICHEAQLEPSIVIKIAKEYIKIQLKKNSSNKDVKNMLHKKLLQNYLEAI